MLESRVVPVIKVLLLWMKTGNEKLQVWVVGQLMKKGTAHEFDSDEAREAGRKGGKAAHEKGTAHEFDSNEAREAGRKGGKSAHGKGIAHEFDSDEAREAGHKDGQSSHGTSNSKHSGTSEQHVKAGSQSHKNK